MKNTVKFFLLCFAALTAASCAKSRVEQMALSEGVRFSCTPDVLTLVGDKIPVDLSVTYPAKYFHPKAVVEMVPVLVYGDTE